MSSEDVSQGQLKRIQRCSYDFATTVITRLLQKFASPSDDTSDTTLDNGSP